MLKEHIKQVIEEIGEGLKGTGLQVSGDITIKYKDESGTHKTSS